MSLGRIYREAARQNHRTAVYDRMQAEAAARPESTQMQTPYGLIWMSPIEIQLYEAMRQEGLDPVPQFYIQGYYTDFAFPDVRLAVEADGAVHDDAEHRERDRKRDWILRRQGWTVQHFHGTTIYHKAANCAYVVRTEVIGRRARIAFEARQRELRRQARHDAMMRPFRALLRLLHHPRHRDEGIAAEPPIRPPESPP